MRGHLRYMSEAGYKVTAVAEPGQRLEKVGRREGVEVRGIKIVREISLVADVQSLWELRRLFRAERPDILNAGTPKASLIAMLAAWSLRVPVRVYTLRGLRSERVHGARGLILRVMERVTSRCATHVVAVSTSLREEYVRRGLAPKSKVVTIAHGSSNGVDSARFQWTSQDRRAARSELGIDDSSPVIGFVGRLVADKGVDELIRAFRMVQATEPKCVLLLVGDFEEGDPVEPSTRDSILEDPSILLTGLLDDAARAYAAMDIVALPSFREGFPNVVLEAACAGVPAVGFDATGTRDAIVHDRTGMLTPIGDPGRLASELIAYLADPERRRRHGDNAALRATRDFDPKVIWSGLSDLYTEAHATVGASQ